MTIPTAGSRPELLRNLITASGLPLENIVLISTKPGIDLPEGTHQIEDFGELNIQRWWTRGIEYAEQQGATQVAVVNDDVAIDRKTLQLLADALTSTGAAIASPSRIPFRDGLHKGRLIPYEPRLWGSLWMLDLSSGLRPDTTYRWWYGDNDLDIRARSRHGGVVLVPVTFEHHHAGEKTGENPKLQALTNLDAQVFEAQYRTLLRRSRLIRKWFGRLKSNRRLT
jgi:GT2 family glycosyltransferase